MERIPPVVFLVGAVVLVALAIWTVIDENWAGLIISVLLAAVCISAHTQRSRA